MHKNRAGALRPRHDLIICVFVSTPTIDREPKKNPALHAAAPDFDIQKNYRAFFAVSTSALKASASLIASSDRLLRFISTFAFFRPFMKRE